MMGALLRNASSLPVSNRRMARLPRCLAVVLVVAVVCMANMLSPAYAYNINYVSTTTITGYPLFLDKGFCHAFDRVSHAAMPTSADKQEVVKQLVTQNAFDMVPLGAYAQQAACMTIDCTWAFNQGLYRGNEQVFLRGVLNGTAGVVQTVPPFFSNFVPNKTPQLWESLDYWGARQVYMRGDGMWNNTLTNTTFVQWVCGTYSFTSSDTEFPTFLDGTVITPDPDNSSMYVQCGHVIKPDNSGIWPAYQCNAPMPWWVGLVIACVVYAIVVIVIITCGCCMCLQRRRREMHTYEKDMRDAEDNPVNLPSQSQVGMGRSASMYGSEA